MNFLTQIVHFAEFPAIGKLNSRNGLLKLILRPLPLRCIHLCLLFFSALPSPIKADDFQSGIDAYHKSKYIEAIEAFERSLESSQNAAAHHNLALSLYQLGQSAAAVWQLERALRLEPLDKTYIFKLGALRQMLGLYDTPTDWWQSAANMLTKNTWIWMACISFWIVIALLAIPRIGGLKRSINLKLSLGIAGACLLSSLAALMIQITQLSSGIVISNEAVDLHHAPASAAPKAGVARPGERAYIIDKHNDFLKVETEAEITGWIQVDAFRKL
ncbi:MAG: tetratricopeptide repeat protein [Verrucomicrobiota bacterium]|nr:tetratricopeptide repeat protein [Verrucomicrobiota bacterium]